ncbi:hypothetical protein SEUCBS139899_008051 [Sporothrix eucalyptigena]|uniref:Cyanovirin-N domain-containing protein n=1 Tax=Sporothrix eucalyptigena TaxID=1812306 RepID=A0ABP0CUG9_9PEZI
MHPSTAITILFPLLAVGSRAASVPPPAGWRVGIDHGHNSDYGTGNGQPDGGPGGEPDAPAFPFADLCNSWKLEYLVSGGELSLWAQCPTQDASGAQVLVNSLLPLESSFVANAQGIKPAYPSNSAPVSFSTICRDCTLPDPQGTVMACNCTTNGGSPLLAVDLTEWITADQGVTCFTDGVVCGTVQSTQAVASSSSTTVGQASSTTVAKEKPTCTEK